MVRTATDYRLPRRASGATAYVALFALALVQLAAVLHHDEHEATELAESCVACVQLEQFNDVVAVTPTAYTVEPEVAIVRTSGSIASIARPMRPYFGRAPPVLS